MSYPAKTILWFSYYMFALSLTLLIVPNVLGGLLGFDESSSIWVRLIGMFMLYLAIDYFQAARGNWRGFFKLSVYLRSTIILFMILFTSLGMLKFIFVPLSLIDFCGAMWTWYALRMEKKMQPSHGKAA